MKADAHPAQADRLATLRRYDILDTPREKDFDEIVDLVAEICEAPIAVVNLIDQDRQWFKAETGLGVRETPLETSICSHVILESDFVEIPDTQNDPRTQDNELCMPEDGLRFYAGALLKGQNGLPIGTLCVLDHKPRTLNDFQRRTLEVLSRRVMRELDLRLAVRDQEILRDEMDHRVKNSLQTIASFVRIYQSQLRKNEDPATVLDAVARRVEAVSALHEALHETANDQHVQLDDFVNRIIGYLSNAAPPNIDISCKVVPIEVNSKMAGSIGVIISEFVANSIKHAFPGGASGHVMVELFSGERELTILCTDDGVGKAAEKVRTLGSSGLGTRLLNAAVSQMNGTLTREPGEKGYRMELIIPLAGQG